MFGKRKKILSIEQMDKIEAWMKKVCFPLIGDCKSDEEMSEKLHLKVEFVSSDDLPPHVEAELAPTEDKNFCGIIRVNAEYKTKRFAYLHEIMHYLMDVGIDNKVEQVYARKSTGHTDSEHEQEINYATASFIMPYTEMVKEIEKYDKNRMNEIKFVSDIAQKYKQPNRAVIRRIQEVRKFRLAHRGMY